MKKKLVNKLAAGVIISAMALTGCMSAFAEEAETEPVTEAAEKEEAEEETEAYTGDASDENTRNQDDIGEKELLVVSFGTSFNDNRKATIGAIEDAMEAAFPEYSVRRGFTSQIIIDHVMDRDGVAIDNVEEALNRAVDNGVKTLVVQPTHLMNGFEYEELMGTLAEFSDSFEQVAVGEPLLTSDEDFLAVADAITAATADYDNGKTAIVFMGHGTSHTAKISYSQMQSQMTALGYENVFIGTVEGEPEDTSCESVIEKVSAAGYKNVILRPLMVVAGDHANNDMAGSDDDSWLSQFKASGKFDKIDTQINGLGEIEGIQKLYVEHTAAAMSK